MKILFDQGTPLPLRRQLPGHRIDTVSERGWSGLANGELLDAEGDGYEVLVTTDQNIKHQKNLIGRRRHCCLDVNCLAPDSASRTGHRRGGRRRNAAHHS